MYVHCQKERGEVGGREGEKEGEGKGGDGVYMLCCGQFTGCDLLI